MATVQEVQNDIYECRVKLLKQMNDYVCNVIGDEEAWSDWITIGVPDGATEDDYEFIAHDQDEWTRICGVFGKLVEVFQS
jgi:hypothetical protein